MDPIIQPSDRPNPTGSDADITVILYKTGRAVKQGLISLINGIGRFFTAIFALFLFLLKNMLWLIVGASIGLLYGTYILKKNGSQYQSEMIVKANFNSSRSLYNTIDYFNALINSSKTRDLSSLFGITEKEAGQISGFSIEPVQSELIKAELYKELFIDDYSLHEGDTAWRRTMNYDDFKRSLTRNDYPVQEITVTGTNAELFSKLQNGIIEHISTIPFLKDAKENQQAINSDEERTIRYALSNLDSLSKAYIRRIGQGGPTPENNQLTILQNTSQLKSPELDLYDKWINIQTILKKSRSRSMSEKNVLEIYSPFNPVGQKISFFRQSVVKFGLYGLALAAIVLLVVALYKSIAKMEKRKQVA